MQAPSNFEDKFYVNLLSTTKYFTQFCKETGLEHCAQVFVKHDYFGDHSRQYDCSLTVQEAIQTKIHMNMIVPVVINWLHTDLVQTNAIYASNLIKSFQ